MPDVERAQICCHQTVSNFASEGIDFGKQLKVPTVGRIIGRGSVLCSVSTRQSKRFEQP